MAVYMPKMVCCSMVGFLLSAWPCLSIAATGNSGVASIDAAEQQAQAKQQAIQMNAAASAPVVSLGKTEKVSESASIIPMDEEGFRIHHIQIQSVEPFFKRISSWWHRMKATVSDKRGLIRLFMY